MRLPDSLQTRLDALTTDLTHLADETARRARAWGESTSDRIRRSSWFEHSVQWYGDTFEERHDEHEWRMSAGLTASQVKTTTAPSNFTLSVMERIAAQQGAVAPIPFIRLARQPAQVLVGALCMSAMLALISSCVLAILAPTQALAMLDGFISVGLIILVFLRELLGMTAHSVGGPVPLLAIGTLSLVAVAMLMRSTRGNDQYIREA